jgi:drug/metabolite transporter superfamily protein YnfA
MNETVIFVGAAVCKIATGFPSLPGSRCYDTDAMLAFGYCVLAILGIALLTAKGLARL